MDFASIMSASIAKAKSTTATSTSDPSKKYIKNAEAEAARVAAYEAQQAALEAERAAKAAAKRKREEEELEAARLREEKRRRLAEEARLAREAREAEEERKRRKSLGLPSPPRPEQKEKEGSVEKDGSGDGDEGLPDEEVIAGLRALGEPATLFGESRKGRRKRYARLLRKAESSSSGPIPTTLELFTDEADMRIGDKVPPRDDVEGRRLLFRRMASYFTLVLKEWGLALEREQGIAPSGQPAGGSAEGKDGDGQQLQKSIKPPPQLTFAQKAARDALAQATANMRPLFRRFERAVEADEAKARTAAAKSKDSRSATGRGHQHGGKSTDNKDDDSPIPDDIVTALVEIVHAAQQRRYVDANDGYLRLSIGKAAWPIGVTMVGIHERSAREKLHAGERGHVMGDEVTRKYLQAIKRCLTFAQVRWPPEDIGQLMG